MEKQSEQEHVTDLATQDVNDNFAEEEKSDTDDHRASGETFSQALSSWVKSPLDYVSHTSRKSFWLVQLFLFVITIITLAPLVYYSTIPSPGPNFDKLMLSLWGLFFLVNMVLFFFNLPLAVRRIRDAGITPYAVCVIIIPFIGWIVVLAMCAFPSKFRNR